MSDLRLCVCHSNAMSSALCLESLISWVYYVSLPIIVPREVRGGGWKDLALRVQSGKVVGGMSVGPRDVPG